MSEPKCSCNCHDPLWRKETRKHEHRTHIYCQKYLLREAAAMEDSGCQREAALRALLAEILSCRVLTPAMQDRAEELLRG